MADQPITVTTDLTQRPDYAEALGHVCAFWANLEWWMFHLFMTLSGAAPAIARSVFYSMESNRARRDLIKAVGQTVIEKKPLFIELDDILGGIGRCARVRNKLVHDTWGVSATQKGEVIQFRLGGADYMRHLEEVSIEDLRRCAEQIQKVRDSIERFVKTIEPMLPPWLDKLRAQPSLALGFAKKGHPPGRLPKGHRSQHRS